MSDWQPLFPVDELAINGTRLAQAGGRELTVVRLADGFFALDDQCTHGNASLSDGAVDGDEIECPFHGGRFNIRTGEACAAPCTVNARTHRCKVEDGQVLVALDGAGGIAPRQEERTIDIEVLERLELAPGIVGLRLASADGSPLPAYAPGAHIDLHLAPGLVRQYSLCCPRPEAQSYRIAVQREPASRGGSARVHDALQVGARLAMGLPRNDFPVVPDAHHHLLLAGGIGITPLLSMAHAFTAGGQPFALHHWVRSRDRAVFRDELQAFGERFTLHVDDEPATRPELAQVLGVPQAGTHLYVCGPRGFMDWVLGTARAAGWTPGQLHCEYFSPATAATA